MWVETSEFLTEESYNVYYEKGGLAYGHWSDKEAECMDAAMLHPLMLVASDGIPFVDGLAHPRGAGTFSRFLGQYVSGLADTTRAQATPICLRLSVTLMIVAAIGTLRLQGA